MTLLMTLRRINRAVALLVGLGLMVCAGVVLADIVMRRVGSSFGGTDEISGYVMAIATSWGMAFTLLELGHVRIDVLRARARAKGRVLVDLFALVVLAGTVSLIAVRCWPVLARSLSNGSRANTPLETPLALVQAPWFAGWVWFAAMAWLTFVAALLLMARGEWASAEEAIGTFGEEDAAA